MIEMMILEKNDKAMMKTISKDEAIRKTIMDEDTNSIYQKCSFIFLNNVYIFSIMLAPLPGILNLVTLVDKGYVGRRTD